MLTDYVNRWIDYQRARGIRIRTLESYAGYIRREITPALGGIELASIKPGHVRWLLSLMKNKGLSAATIAQARGVLRSILRQAVEEGLIPVNPVTAVNGPKVRRPESHWPTPAELVDLIQAARGTVWEIPMLLAATTGARRSEVLGVAWRDVDLNAGAVFIVRDVQRAVDPRSSEDIVFTPLKTKRARRQVQLPTFALVRLRQHRRDQLERRSNQSAGWRDPVDEIGEPIAMVCERGDGFLIHPDSFTHAFKKARAAKRQEANPLGTNDHPHSVGVTKRGVHGVVDRLHRLRLGVARLVDLSEPHVLAAMGVSSQDLAGDDHARCRQVGGGAAWLGCDAIIVPSARASGNNLVVFVDNQEPDSPLEVVHTQDPP